MTVHPDYETPPAGGTSGFFDAFAFTRHFLGWALAVVVLTLPCIFILPRYERLLAEYNAPVPPTTAVALAAARWVRSYGILLAPVALAHSLAVALWYPRAGLNGRRIYRLLLTLFVCGLFAFVILSLFLPIASITNSLSGAATK